MALKYKMKKEPLQIAEERREVKSKGEKERYTHLIGELQRIARRDKKAFLSEQCKEMEENNRVEKNKGIVKKIGGIKQTFHARMCMIKDRNGKDLPETEEVEKRWQEYTEELYKKGLNDLDNHDGVVTHLEPDILECEVCFHNFLIAKCALFCNSISECVAHYHLFYFHSYTLICLKLTVCEKTVCRTRNNN